MSGPNSSTQDQSALSGLPENHDAFGNWISGFTDGEGHFQLFWQKYKTRRWLRIKRNGNAVFAITLRHDDLAILEQIQSFWGAGNINAYHYENNKRKPFSRLAVHGVKTLKKIIVPHFERYPLRAKKARDFLIWKEGIELLYRVNCRPMEHKQGKRNMGFAQKWTEKELAEFNVLVTTLKAQRRYDQRDALPLPEHIESPDNQGMLF